MIDAGALAREVDLRLRKATDRERQRFTRNYFPSALENLGVATPILRRLAHEMARRLEGASPATVLAFARALLAQRTLEGRQVAYLTLYEHPETLRSAAPRTIVALGRGMDNWASVDTFGCYVAGPAWRDGRLTDAHVRLWSRSRDRWWRRAALVATVGLHGASRDGRGEARRTLALCRALAADRDDMVFKALSWALRELGKRDPASVRAFLEERASELHPRVLREVRSKLTTGRKTPGRRCVPRQGQSTRG